MEQHFQMTIVNKIPVIITFMSERKIISVLVLPVVWGDCGSGGRGVHLPNAP